MGLCFYFVIDVAYFFIAIKNKACELLSELLKRKMVYLKKHHVG